jgi:hypothetical protein
MRADKRARALTALAVGTVIALAGCGGGGDSTTSGGSANATTPASQESSGATMKHTMHDQNSMHHSEDSMHGG